MPVDNRIIIELNTFLKSIIVWGSLIAVIVILPFQCHFKVGDNETRPDTFEFTIGKGENTIELNNDYRY